jgi:thiol-disulfide isomerase/thioredoxin
MTRSRRQRTVDKPPDRRMPLVLGVGALVIIAAAVAAVLLAPSAPPPVGSAAPGSSSPVSASSAAAGADLPAFAPGGDDPAVGRPIPEVQGIAFDGTPVGIKADGRPKVIVFLAHWCPHCQREVPVVQSWLDAKGMPAAVDLVSVATAIDPNRPNYPPDAWLTRERWGVPVIVDADGQVATRYGLTAFPFWVTIRADGTVAQRLTGELTPDQLDALVASVSSP